MNCKPKIIGTSRLFHQRKEKRFSYFICPLASLRLSVGPSVGPLDSDALSKASPAYTASADFAVASAIPISATSTAASAIPISL